MNGVDRIRATGPESRGAAGDGRRIEQARANRVGSASDQSRSDAVPTTPMTGGDGIKQRLDAASRRLDDLLQRHSQLRAGGDAGQEQIGDVEREITETEIALQNILTIDSPTPDNIDDVLGEGVVADTVAMKGANISHERVLELLEG